MRVLVMSAHAPIAGCRPFLLDAIAGMGAVHAGPGAGLPFGFGGLVAFEGTDALLLTPARDPFEGGIRILAADHPVTRHGSGSLQGAHHRRRTKSDKPCAAGAVPSWLKLSQGRSETRTF